MVKSFFIHFHAFLISCFRGYFLSGKAMIDHIRGRLALKSPIYVRVEVNGIGYGVHIPLSTYDYLPGMGEEIELYTFLHVREDCLQLFGFKTAEEKELFEMLVSVSGVGPRLALRILSGLSVREFRECIGQENLILLTSVPGVGRKTAQRLVIDLKEKIGIVLAAEDVKKMTGTAEEEQVINDAVSALISLGCKPSEAAKAVKEARISLPKKIPLEDLVKEALKHL